MDFGKENYEVTEENDMKRVSIVSDEILNKKSDNFTLDMEPFSHLTNKDLSLISRINLQRGLSRKGTEKNMKAPNTDSQKDATSSPTASAIQEKPKLVTTSDIGSAQVHHQITIMTNAVVAATTTSTGTPTKTKFVVKRSNCFKQSSIINPRRVLLFFATLSSMGTILLIFFTLNMARYNEDDNYLN